MKNLYRQWQEKFFTHEANLVEEKDDTSSYKVDWNSTYVFQNLRIVTM